KSLGQGTMTQLGDDDLLMRPTPESLSIAMIVWHVSGNLESRFTDFLTTDGEKPSRDRDGEFLLTDEDTRANLLAAWERGWKTLLDSVQSLRDADLDRVVSIRGEGQTARQALLRAMTHIAYHTGQILYLVRFMRPESSWLTIPPSRSRGQPGTYRKSP
ncbi:MAG: DinB family protein, partial [Pirellulales bacterium]